MTHIRVGNLTIIGSDNGLSPGRRQAIIWTNAGILLIGPLGTYISEILIASSMFSFNKMRLKVSSAKWRPFCLGINVLMTRPYMLTFEYDRSTHVFTVMRDRKINGQPVQMNFLSFASILINTTRCEWRSKLCCLEISDITLDYRVLNLNEMPKLYRLRRWSLGMDNDFIPHFMLDVTTFPRCD